jgi:hypothetical protein
MKTKFALILAIALSGGCVSVPYIEDTGPGAYINCTLYPDSIACQPGELAYSLNLVDRTKELYRQKLIQEFKRKQNLSTATILLSAATLGLAAYGADSDAILGAALAGGVTYSLGTWNWSQDRLTIYLEGMRAMDCIRSSVAPINRGSDYFVNLKNVNADLWKAHIDTAVAVGKLSAILAAIGESNLPMQLAEAAKTEISNSETGLARSLQLLQKNSALQTKIMEVPAKIDSVVHAVRTSVDQALNGTLSDLSTLRSHMQGLNSFVQIYAPGLDLDASLQEALEGARGESDVSTTQSAKTSKTRNDEVATAFGNLIEKKHSLLAVMGIAQGFVDKVDTAAEQLDLSGCGVDTTKFSSSIALDRTRVEFVAGKAQTSYVRITGGTTPYVAGLVDHPADGINVSVLTGSNQIAITATDKTVAGSSYKVSVADSASPQHTATLTISVSPPPQSNVPPPAPNDCAIVESLNWTQDEVCLVQRVVRTKVDKVFGTITCTAIKEQWDEALDFETDTRPAGSLSEQQAEKVLSQAKVAFGLQGGEIDADAIKAACEGDKEPSLSATDEENCELPGAENDNELECVFTAADMVSLKEQLNARLQITLDVESESGFDEKLREAIKQFQLQAGLLTANDDGLGHLSSETLSALESGSSP